METLLVKGISKNQKKKSDETNNINKNEKRKIYQPAWRLLNTLLRLLYFYFIFISPILLHIFLSTVATTSFSAWESKQKPLLPYFISGTPWCPPSIRYWALIIKSGYTALCINVCSGLPVLLPALFGYNVVADARSTRLNAYTVPLSKDLKRILQAGIFYRT